ncbi:hypothetical protein [Bacillus toyonensis]|uniref:hypothetical protein n=1 Tax=Bacillus toyonensis TaxID=155322 RepID=UPI001CFB4026|nr:hypothetical protein [Bacillus toyonensis]UFH99689.1 hypothetical protein HQN46_0010215 [Bacillus toyonensis]
MKKAYKCFVRWTHSDKNYLSEFAVETDKGSIWLHSDIARRYNQQFRYTIDGGLLGIDIEEITDEKETEQK